MTRDFYNHPLVSRSAGWMFHIIEEVDGKYIDRVTCTSYEEAEEIVKAVGGHFLIVSASEVDGYLYLQNDDTEYDF